MQTWSRLPGTVWRGLIFFTTDSPHYRRMPPLSGDNHGWVVSAVRTGCALGHRAITIRACAHLMKTAAQHQLRAQGRSFVPGPNKFGGITGRSPGERPHYGIAGESPGKWDLMWTQGVLQTHLPQMWVSLLCSWMAPRYRRRSGIMFLKLDWSLAVFIASNIVRSMTSPFFQ